MNIIKHENWNGSVNKQPIQLTQPNQFGTLNVIGEITSSPSLKPSLIKRVPQGSNPAILLLDLIMSSIDTDTATKQPQRVDYWETLNEKCPYSSIEIHYNGEIITTIKVDTKNTVGTPQTLSESELEAQRQKVVAQLEKGNVLKGRVKNITDFGAFIDVGGIDGLLNITDISWETITHPSELLSLNQALNVVVLDVDNVQKRLTLGLKQLTPKIKNTVLTPQTLSESDLEAQRQQIVAQLEKGQILKGRVKNITDFGAFIDLGGIDGLLNISDISWEAITHPSELLTLNQELDVVVLNFDHVQKRISLGLKQLEPSII